MAEQSVTLQPSESKVVSFEATPTVAKTYQVLVNGLTGSFVAIKAEVEVTRINLSKTILTDSFIGKEPEAFTISIAFSNPFDYDVWVRPKFSFGEQAVLGGYDYSSGGFWDDDTWVPGYWPGLTWVWVDLGGQYSGDLIPEAYGSGMTVYVYDPEGIPMVTGEHAYLKVPARGQASTSLKWYMSTNITHSEDLIGYGGYWGITFYCNCVPGNEYAVRYLSITGIITDFGISKVVEAYPPKVLDVLVQTLEAFYAKYSPGCGTFRGKTVNYKKTYLEAISGILPEGVTLLFKHPDYYEEYAGQHRHYFWKWQRFLRLEDNTPIFEDATPPDWW